MPSQGTQRRTIRIADEIWDPAEKRAKREGREVADVIREHLTQYGIWEPAEQRAADEGRDLLEVLREYLTRYATETPEEDPPT
ncbi:hypothetical protein ACQPW1_00325 [Nocardia sp. CA-128927]|uniref:hypothetical protein n=1 Tax=Nocardia sp. CA-128927 TaxID=3239975 RepID=UPI003D9785ED